LREEGGFNGLKLRLGRERLADDLAAIEAVREAVGSEMSLMVDFNQGLHLGEVLERCHAIDDLGLAWIEEHIERPLLPRQRAFPSPPISIPKWARTWQD
jgi:mandelate racemase